MLKRWSQPLNFPLSVSASKEMGDHTRQKKESPTSAGIEPTTFGLDHRCSTDWARSLDQGKWWVIMVGLAAMWMWRVQIECCAPCTKDTNDG